MLTVLSYTLMDKVLRKSSKSQLGYRQHRVFIARSKLSYDQEAKDTVSE